MAQASLLRRNGVSCHDFAYNNDQSEEHAYTAPTIMPTPGIFHKLMERTKGYHEKAAYLLSASDIRTIQHYWAYDAIKRLLNRSHTAVILLVPLKFITHPLILKIYSLRLASGTSFNAVPFNPQSTSHDSEVADFVKRVAKIKKVDGFMAFEEDVESRIRLAQIVNVINARADHSNRTPSIASIKPAS